MHVDNNYMFEGFSFREDLAKVILFQQNTDEFARDLMEGDKSFQNRL